MGDYVEMHQNSSLPVSPSPNEMKIPFYNSLYVVFREPYDDGCTLIYCGCVLTWAKFKTLSEKFLKGLIRQTKN